MRATQPKGEYMTREERKALEAKIRASMDDAVRRGWEIARGQIRDPMNKQCDAMGSNPSVKNLTDAAMWLGVSPMWVHAFCQGWDRNMVHPAEPKASRLGMKLRQEYVVRQ